LGQTRDDAAGEAFDKVAKLLGLGYPGGPEIDRLARHGDAAAVAFPRGMGEDPGFSFSFSGLKTAVRYFLEKHPAAPLADVCASFQEAVVDVLVTKTLRAVAATGVRTVAVAGGVSLNSRLRARLAQECDRSGIRLLLADAALCTDNAAMIAAVVFDKLPRGVPHGAVTVAPSAGLV
jgi:N6-L-threonylcarbamoyladenine synthase